MEKRSYRRILLQIGLLALVFFFVGCPQQMLSQEAKRSIPTTFPIQAVTERTTPSALSGGTTAPSALSGGTTASFALSGSSVWILSCLDGWERQKIYQANPYYMNEQGVKKARDIYVFGNFWLQPSTGALLSYSDQPEMLRCLSNLITTVHSQYHAHVCGVMSVNETSGGWKPSDVVSYTKRAVADSSLLTPIADQAKKYPYDCLINDIEDGDSASPMTFSQYDAFLRSTLPVPLGQTLLWKTSTVSSYWQTWEDWKTLANNADFFIIMALDQDSMSNPPVPAPIVSDGWIKEVYTYMRSVPHLFGTHSVAWELPTYYRLFTQRPHGSWAISAGTDVETQFTAALKSKTILKNYVQDLNDPYLEYSNAQGQITYLFFETAKSSDTLAQTLTGFNESTCLLLSFWDNDSGTSNSLGWSTISVDRNVHLC